MLALDSQLVLEGFGDRRMAEVGFTLWRRTARWASIGPLAALPRIPLLLAAALFAIPRLLQRPPALIVLIDYGAFHVRFARLLRHLGYRGPILYIYPPGAWLRRDGVARDLAAAALPVTPFAAQAAHYRALGLAIEHIAHPLARVFPQRPARPAPAADGGHVAFLPGSRLAELRAHLPVMMAVVDRMRTGRPNLRVDVVAADPRFVPVIEQAIAGRPNVGIARNAHALFATVDAALVKSGTAVLEAALSAVPTVAMYILSPQLAWIVKHVFHFRGGFVTLPNLILGRASISERLQDDACAKKLADDVEALLREPRAQLDDFRELRTMLEQGTSLDELAKRVLSLR